jgi:hypothetical protein
MRKLADGGSVDDEGMEAEVSVPLDLLLGRRTHEIFA